MYIVNPGGTVHVVSDEAGAALLDKPGWKKPTEDEIAAWEKEFLPEGEAKKRADERKKAAQPATPPTNGS